MSRGGQIRQAVPQRSSEAGGNVSKSAEIRQLPERMPGTQTGLDGRGKMCGGIISLLSVLNLSPLC